LDVDIGIKSRLGLWKRAEEALPAATVSAERKPALAQSIDERDEPDGILSESPNAHQELTHHSRSLRLFSGADPSRDDAVLRAPKLKDRLNMYSQQLVEVPLPKEPIVVPYEDDFVSTPWVTAGVPTQ